MVLSLPGTCGLYSPETIRTATVVSRSEGSTRRDSVHPRHDARCGFQEHIGRLAVLKVGIGRELIITGPSPQRLRIRSGRIEWFAKRQETKNEK